MAQATIKPPTIGSGMLNFFKIGSLALMKCPKKSTLIATKKDSSAPTDIK
ncbi:hypothetical protein GCM10007906_44540 [Vibrio hyugaensis]|uniref:Uncharacterized protein n=1 Tax=Vibrio hyugaensis TaxID=1534743 RepID=A0ABQ5YBT5_9VIBR|nr:hypothetical protein GCM10007906_44540 [Vibrio hyugaensis]